MSSIEISNLSKSFTHNGEDSVVLDNLNLKVEQGDFLVILGASGTGKSTLLRIISGLETQDTGHILIENDIVDEVSAGNRNVGMVFQSYALYPHLNVFENIAFGIRYREEFDVNELKKRVKGIAEMLELDAILEYYPKQLSGGQQQRVAIGRALIMKPKVLLFDEPLSNLDALLRTKLRLKIAEYHRYYQSTTIYVTHDQHEAMALADKIVVMNKGKIEQIGSPQELYEKPNSQFVAGFLGFPPMNFLASVLTKSNNNGFIITVGEQQIPLEEDVLGNTSQDIFKEQSIILGIRPEHVHIDKRGALEGAVESIDYLGANSVAYIKLNKNNGLFQVKIGEQQVLGIGEKVALNLSLTHIHLFNHDGKSLFAS